jgi:hypothetical protein
VKVIYEEQNKETSLFQIQQQTHSLFHELNFLSFPESVLSSSSDFISFVKNFELMFSNIKNDFTSHTEVKAESVKMIQGKVDCSFFTTNISYNI